MLLTTTFLVSFFRLNCDTASDRQTLLCLVLFWMFSRLFLARHVLNLSYKPLFQSHYQSPRWATYTTFTKTETHKKRKQVSSVVVVNDLKSTVCSFTNPLPMQRGRALNSENRDENPGVTEFTLLKQIKRLKAVTVKQLRW